MRIGHGVAVVSLFVFACGSADHEQPARPPLRVPIAPVALAGEGAPKVPFELRLVGPDQVAPSTPIELVATLIVTEFPGEITLRVETPANVTLVGGQDNEVVRVGRGTITRWFKFDVQGDLKDAIRVVAESEPNAAVGVLATATFPLPATPTVTSPQPITPIRIGRITVKEAIPIGPSQ